MRDCGCKWDGALDGRLLRCKTHAVAYKAERANRNGQAEIDRLNKIINEVRKHSRPVRYIVEMAERNHERYA